MIWVGRSVEILNVTRVTICRRRGEVSVDVATGARNCRVRPCERKRSLAVIEGRRGPSHGAVAGRTSRRYARLSVRRVGCPVEVFYMAAKAIRRSALVFPADVAGEAIQRGVCAG